MDDMDETTRRPEAEAQRVRRRGGAIGTLLVAGVAGATGAAAAYLLDPERGRARRALARDRLGAVARRGMREAERAGRTASARAQGLSRKVAHLRAEGVPILDGASLAEKVSTEIFRDSSIPKGQINLNVERGVVVLRGQLESEEQIAEVESRARRVAGVWDVQNLVHLPGLPAPAEV